MWTWLYNTKGKAVAFIHKGNVFSTRGKFVGVLKGKVVWNSEYMGEIVDEDLFLYRVDHPTEVMDSPIHLPNPGAPSAPGDKRAVGMKGGFRDVRV
ncbi:MAG TPA: hypothetical protein VK934_08260 [Fimbriimonas sp.]|nr:hypothetical protein [Fimbriimonas sp.]